MDRFRIGAAVAVLIVVLTFLGFLVHEKADPTMMAALAVVAGGAITAVVSYIAKAPSDASKGPPPGAIAFVLSVGAVLAGTASIGCSSSAAKRVEAAGAYSNELARCDDAAPTLPPDAPMDRRREAWAEYDDCVSAAHTRWGVVMTTTKDGGR